MHSFIDPNPQPLGGVNFVFFHKWGPTAQGAPQWGGIKMSLLNWHGFRALINGMLEQLIIRTDVGVKIRRLFRHNIIPSLKLAHFTVRRG